MVEEITLIISSAVGALISLAFLWIPGLNTWFDDQAPGYKALAQVGLGAVVAAIMYGLACYGVAGDFDIPVTCDQAGFIVLIKAFGSFILGNQSAFLLTNKPAKARIRQ